MNRLFVALLVLCLAMPVAAETTATHIPVTSKAELDRYLRNTPAGSSPLDQLSPGGRRRFLAELRFSSQGAGVAYAEPAAELTQPQIEAIFALFGQQPPPGIGLAPEEKSRRDQERAAAANVRGCVPADCPESEIEHRYDSLVITQSDPTLPDVQRFAAEKRRYDQLFAE